MRIVHRQVFVGPSVFSLVPHARLFVELDAGDRAAATVVERIGRRLRRFAPDHADAVVGEVPPDAPAPLAIAHVGRALLRRGGGDTDLAEAFRVGPGRAHVAIGLEDPLVAAAALDLAGAAAADGPDDACAAAAAAYRAALADGTLTPALRLQWRAARRRGIPGHLVFTDAALLQLGHGRLQHRIAGTTGSRTPAVALAVSRNRPLSRTLLHRAGMLQTEAILVSTPAAAMQAARRIGYPVRVYGGGASRDAPPPWIDDDDALAAACRAERAGGPVRVEGGGRGHMHHFAVIAGRVAAVARRATTRTWHDVTAQLHDGHRRTAEAAARAIGLDVAGVEAFVPDIAGDPAAGVMTVAAVAADPGLALHDVAAGSGDPTAALVATMFPPGADGRIPVAAITGTNGKTTTARMVARIMGAAGSVLGLADTNGVEVDGRILARGDLAGPAGARLVLEDPTVEVAVLETARGGIWRQGLWFDRCTVAAVLNVGDDHVGTEGIPDRATLAEIKGLITRVATDVVVLNARDPFCVALRRGSPASRACFVSLDPAHPLVGIGRAAGDEAVTVVGEGPAARVVLHRDAGETVLATVGAIAATDGGRARHNIENALFAAAIAVGLGAAPAAIGRGLASYDLSYATSRGRLAISDALPFRVIVDYGHNAPAIAAMRDYVAASRVTGRRICMLNAPGNRVDAHYAALAAAAAGGFDYYVCTGPDERRGRAPGEVGRRIADGLLAAGIPAAQVAVVDDEAAAVPAALAAASPGDLVVLFCHDPERCWRLVHGG